MLSMNQSKTNTFVRALRAFAAQDGNLIATLNFVEQNFGEHSDELAVVRKIASVGDTVSFGGGFDITEKAAVPAAVTPTADWAGSVAETIGRAFISQALEPSVYNLLMPVQPNTNLTGVGSGGSASFTQEGQAQPITKLTLTDQNLSPLMCHGIFVISKELARSSDPRAFELFKHGLFKAIIDAVDGKLLDNANSGGSGAPASPLNGVSAISATANATSDIRDLIDSFQGDLTESFFVGSPKVMAALNSAERPYCGIKDGELLGARAIASRNAPSGDLILIDRTGVVTAQGGFEISVSDQASLQMSDSPTSPTQMVSLWQNDLVALRVSLNVNFSAVRAGSAAFVSGANW